MGKLEHNQKALGPQGWWGGEFLGSRCLAHYEHFHQDLGVFCGTQGMHIAQCVQAAGRWLSLGCQQQTSWAQQGSAAGPQAAATYQELVGLILQRAPRWAAAGY